MDNGVVVSRGVGVVKVIGRGCRGEVGQCVAPRPFPRTPLPALALAITITVLYRLHHILYFYYNLHIYEPLSRKRKGHFFVPGDKPFL